MHGSCTPSISGAPHAFLGVAGALLVEIWGPEGVAATAEGLQVGTIKGVARGRGTTLGRDRSVPMHACLLRKHFGQAWVHAAGTLQALLYMVRFSISLKGIPGLFTWWGGEAVRRGEESRAEGGGEGRERGDREKGEFLQHHQCGVHPQAVSNIIGYK